MKGLAYTFSLIYSCLIKSFGITQKQFTPKTVFLKNIQRNYHFIFVFANFVLLMPFTQGIPYNTFLAIKTLNKRRLFCYALKVFRKRKNKDASVLRIHRNYIF